MEEGVLFSIIALISLHSQRAIILFLYIRVFRSNPYPLSRGLSISMILLGVVADTFNHRTGEAEAG